MDTPRSELPHFTNAPAAELDDRRFEANSFLCSGTTSSNARVASTRSPPPPNPAAAFANPEQRRREDRSAAISSHVLADLASGLRRTKSRRPTFTEEQTAANGSGDEALTTSEEDICFLPPEESKVRGGIDFQEMYEFVADQSRAKPGGTRGKISTCGDPIGSLRFDQIKAKEDLPLLLAVLGKRLPCPPRHPPIMRKPNFGTRRPLPVIGVGVERVVLAWVINSDYIADSFRAIIHDIETESDAIEDAVSVLCTDASLWERASGIAVWLWARFSGKFPGSRGSASDGRKAVRGGGNPVDAKLLYGAEPMPKR
ncbi:unnamed protein product [Tuber aestivum]|uniref:Uncharacterized protein n=1 Tax=Tuber aestivum TaxID=59557 RepID=A0A292PPB8_9PEZI|nr:unnamed protein product [Tuber aestivum]